MHIHNVRVIACVDRGMRVEDTCGAGVFCVFLRIGAGHGKTPLLPATVTMRRVNLWVGLQQKNRPYAAQTPEARHDQLRAENKREISRIRSPIGLAGISRHSAGDTIGVRTRHGRPLAHLVVLKITRADGVDNGVQLSR